MRTSVRVNVSISYRIKLMKNYITGMLFAFFSLGANAASIDFNDGINGSAITTQYSGLTFSNAKYDSFVSANEGSVGAGGLKLVSQTVTYFNKSDNPIVITFDSPISSFNIYGLNVGANGARVEAYDAVGGNLVDFAQAFGTTTGVLNHPLLSVSGLSIIQLLLFQPSSVLSEGMLWDNLSYTSADISNVPIPAAAFMFAPALLGFLGLRRKVKLSV
jgi:hypothetical protein